MVELSSPSGAPRGVSRALESVHADPWGQDFLDLATLNAHASQAVEDAVEHVRRSARIEARGLRSSSIVILGPPGAGKTHLFARLRKKLGPRGVLVLVRPLVHAEMTPRFVLGELVRQLAFAPPRGLSQTSALVGSLLGRLEGLGAAFPSTVLGEYLELSPSERNTRLEIAMDGMLALCPELDEQYLARLMQVPFVPSATARALLAWLSGQDCDPDQLARIGARSSLGEARTHAALRTLAAASALGAPLVMVFDQLENLMDVSGAGSRLCAYANLAAELIDTLRGMVFVHLALDAEWERGIEPALNPAQLSRIVMRRELLALPGAAERRQLLELFYRHVRSPAGLFPWPFTSARLSQLENEPGFTPRMLLQELKATLDGMSDSPEPAPTTATPDSAGSQPVSSRPPGSAPPVSPARRDIASEWLGRLRSAREAVREAAAFAEPLPPARLADGVLALGRFVPGLVIKANPRPPAQLSLEVGGDVERVVILQEVNQRSLGAVLGQLTRAAEQTDVVVLRERARGLPAGWVEVLRRRDALLATRRARWIEIAPEDCARLLALAAFLQAASSGDVTDSRGLPVNEAEVADWIEATLDIGAWPLASALAGGGDDAAEPDGSNDRAPVSFLEELGGAARRELAHGRLATALPTLQKLRVASFERLVREVLRLDPGATRASVLAELDAAGDTVRWLGRSIVFLRENE
jgi:hypothetical protein